MLPALFYTVFFAGMAFAFGACVGSFLNVVIHRLPRGLGVNEPERSFCPHCEQLIPWYRNLPLITWLSQGGKGACCGKPIAARYFVVELLTALLFLITYLTFPLALSVPYLILLALLVAGTFIDFEHFIIPDEITLGMTFTGLVVAFLNPALTGVAPTMVAPWTYGMDERLLSLGHACFGALVGYATIWAIIQLGKMAFGKRSVQLENEHDLKWTREGDDAKLWVTDPKDPDEHDEPDQWSEMFSRPKDRLVLKGGDFRVLHNNGREEKLETAKSVSASWNKLFVGEREIKLDDLQEIHGKVSGLIIPQEAMGLGDAKLMAGVGAFLGWPAVYASIFGGSILGTVIVLGAALFSRRELARKIPFGPYLSAGAVLWLFFGEQILGWYLELLQPPV